MLDTIKIKSFIENLTREEGILCNTSKNADKIIFTAMELGYSWINKDRADTQWNTYKEQTCYFSTLKTNSCLIVQRIMLKKKN